MQRYSLVVGVNKVVKQLYKWIFYTLIDVLLGGVPLHSHTVPLMQVITLSPLLCFPSASLYNEIHYMTKSMRTPTFAMEVAFPLQRDCQLESVSLTHVQVVCSSPPLFCYVTGFSMKQQNQKMLFSPAVT